LLEQEKEKNRNLDLLVLSKEDSYRILLFSLLAGVLIYGFFAMRMDFHEYNFAIPDSLDMLSYHFWIFLSLLYILLLVFFFKARKEFIGALTISAAYIFVAFPLSQWPNVMGFDQFLHASTAKLVGSPESSSNQINDIYLNYPIAAIIQSAFAKLAGLDYVLVATILAGLIRAASIAGVYFVAAKVLDKKIAGLAVLLFLVSNFRFNEYYQYAPQTIAFFLFTVLLYAYLRMNRSRPFLLLVLLSYGIMAATHVYASFFALATFGSLFVIERIFRRKITPTATVTAVLLVFMLNFWIFWQLYPGLPGLDARSSELIDISKLANIFQEATTIGRSAYSQVLLGYQFAIQAFLVACSAVAIIIARNQIPSLLIALLVALIFLVFQLIVTSNPPELITLDKALYFGVLPASLLTIYLLNRFFFEHSRWMITISGFGLIIMMLIPLAFFASSEYSYMNSVKIWEIHASAFAVRHLGEGYQEKTGMMDSISSKIFTYYSYDVAKAKPFEKGDFIHRNQADPQELLPNEDIIMTSQRLKVDWYYNQGTPPEKWNRFEQLLQSNAYNRIYDNYFTRIYTKVQ
jgi:hypothetical protein